MDNTTPLTPNIKALMSERWAQLMIDRAGDAGGEFGKTAAVAARIAENGGENLKSDMREAFEWTCAVVKALRFAPDGNFKSDEEAAGVILARINLRKRQLGRRGI